MVIYAVSFDRIFFKRQEKLKNLTINTIIFIQNHHFKKNTMIVNNIYHNDIPPNINFGKSIAIDTEALGLNINRDRLCLAQMCDDKQNVYFIKFDGNDYSAPNFRKILEDESILKIFHFARFDVAALCHYLNIPKINNIFCTKIASKLVRTYTDFHGLKSICKELLNVELEKESQTSYWGGEYLTEKQKKYAASDVLYLHEIHSILVKRLELHKRTEIAQAFFDVLHTVCKCDLIGFDSASIINHH